MPTYRGNVNVDRMDTFFNPEPEPNWRSMYEDMRKRFELADARATDINIRNLELASELEEYKLFLQRTYDASHDDSFDAAYLEFVAYLAKKYK